MSKNVAICILTINAFIRVLWIPVFCEQKVTSLTYKPIESLTAIFRLNIEIPDLSRDEKPA